MKGCFFFQAITMNIIDHQDSIQFAFKIFQVLESCKWIERKRKKGKKHNDIQCQVSSQWANPHSVDSLSTSCNPIKFNSAQVFTGMTNTKAYFPLGLLKNQSSLISIHLQNQNQTIKYWEKRNQIQQGKNTISMSYNPIKLNSTQVFARVHSLQILPTQINFL